MNRRRRNIRITAAAMVAVLAGMTGLVAKSETLYRLFCQATGYGGTPRIAQKASDTVGEAVVTVRFDANVNGGLPWRFRPVQSEMKVHVGEQALAFFEATNVSSEPLVGKATFNIQPDRAASYFNKVQCFCFTEQALAPDQTARMPVTFFVDPEMMKDEYARDVKTITLSYTFFKSDDQSKARVALIKSKIFSN